jgi:hypothetical protein
MLLRPEVRDGATELRRRFEAGQPFRHVVIDDFLEDGFCRELMAQFPSFDPARALNERGQTGRKAVFAELARLRGAYARFDELIRGREFLEWVSRATGIADLRYDPEYVGSGTHENLDGQDLDSHIDFNYHPTRRWHRRLNLIVFLNTRWEESWGGCLELLRDPWTKGGARPSEMVIPVANRAVIFETNEFSWHGFRRIQLPPEAAGISRRSIAVYFYTTERPAAEIAASHGTLYVQQPLSERIQSGYTLGEQDVEELRVLLERRDQQVRFLYHREQQFSALIAGLLRSPSFRLGQALTWPARAARKLLGRGGPPSQG